MLLGQTVEKKLCFLVVTHQQKSQSSHVFKWTPLVSEHPQKAAASVCCCFGLHVIQRNSVIFCVRFLYVHEGTVTQELFNWNGLWCKVKNLFFGFFFGPNPDPWPWNWHTRILLKTYHSLGISETMETLVLLWIQSEAFSLTNNIWLSTDSGLTHLTMMYLYNYCQYQGKALIKNKSQVKKIKTPRLSLRPPTVPLAKKKHPPSFLTPAIIKHFIHTQSVLEAHRPDCVNRISNRYRGWSIMLEHQKKDAYSQLLIQYFYQFWFKHLYLLFAVCILNMHIYLYAATHKNAS